jgi:hypothetical protein
MQLSKQRQPAVRHRQRLVQIISKPMQYGSSLSASALRATFTKPILLCPRKEISLGHRTPKHSSATSSKSLKLRATSIFGLGNARSARSVWQQPIDFGWH